MKRTLVVLALMLVMCAGSLVSTYVAATTAFNDLATLADGVHAAGDRYHYSKVP